MPRIQQGPEVEGCQKWIQTLVNEKRDLLTSLIGTKLELSNTDTITWHSPLAEDGYAEYQDRAFLDLLNIRLPKYPFLTSGCQRGYAGMHWSPSLGVIDCNGVVIVLRLSYVTSDIEGAVSHDPD